MPRGNAALAEFKIGTYICPKTKAEVPLFSCCPLPYLHWPMVVQKCRECGEQHVLQCQDVQHPPTFGYE